MAWDFLGIFKRRQPKTAVSTKSVDDKFLDAIQESVRVDSPALACYVQNKEFRMSMNASVEDYLILMKDLMVHGSEIFAQGNDKAQFQILQELNRITVMVIQKTAEENQLMKNPIGGGGGLPN